MRRITHRELRNNSSKILREVQGGESIEVTNHGEVAAILIPPTLTPYQRAVAAGRVREATGNVDFRTIKGRKLSVTSDEILGDIRGSLIAYVDTSAAIKVVLAEPESQHLRTYLERLRTSAHDTLVSSFLLQTELYCARNRRPESLDCAEIENVLGDISLVDIERSDLVSAPTLPGKLRSSDAIHLAAAIRLNSDVMVVYDADLSAPCEMSGIKPVALIRR